MGRIGASPPLLPRAAKATATKAGSPANCAGALSPKTCGVILRERRAEPCPTPIWARDRRTFSRPPIRRPERHEVRAHNPRRRILRFSRGEFIRSGWRRGFVTKNTRCHPEGAPRGTLPSPDPGARPKDLLPASDPPVGTRHTRGHNPRRRILRRPSGEFIRSWWGEASPIPRRDFLRERRAQPCPTPIRRATEGPYSRPQIGRPEHHTSAATIRAGGFCDFPAANSFAPVGDAPTLRHTAPRSLRGFPLSLPRVYSPGQKPRRGMRDWLNRAAPTSLPPPAYAPAPRRG
jgi:hypothetical protein